MKTGPPSLPIIGHLHMVGPIPHQAFHRISSSYGPIIHLRLGSSSLVVVNTAEGARDVYKTSELAFADRPQSYASRKFAYGSAGFAFAPYGPYWKFVKKLCMSELLGGRTLDALSPIRRQERLRLVEALRDSARRGRELNVSEELNKVTNNVIIRMVTGMASHGVEGGRVGEARELAKGVAETIGAFNASDFIWVLNGFDVQGLKRRIDNVHKRFDALMERIIQRKEEERRIGGGGERSKDLLDIMLDVLEDDKAEVRLTRENIKGLVLDIFTAGSDTTAASLEWALSELINNPSIQKKARQEIDSVIGIGRLVEESDIPNLPYLQAIVKETLRLHPPAPLATRIATQDAKILGHDVPAHTFVFVNVWSINKDPNHWPDPLEFSPARFLNLAESLDVRGQHYHYVPFGSGRRSCPGASLALNILHVTLALLIQCFEWEAGVGENGERRRLDMIEGIGLTVPREHPIICVPKVRLDPFPSF
ncbi:Cytochrome P450 93A2 [Acorus calamus]|uniref:Cytochrome P450 93A2 n=1 Tax=Acorus calamus TaxID=4465 RepID=A0AAV9DZT9_ACOCL|nr:Cytochrome P450 93A2 [Acorus calamus]